MYRLCRDLADILAVREWCRWHTVKLRVLYGALSSTTDLAATDATTTMLVNVLVSVGQFQRDLQNELTREGLAAAWASGAKSGRRPQIAALGATAQVRTDYLDGVSIAALARRHQVSRVAIRTAVADLMPGSGDRHDPTRAKGEPQQPIRIEIPGTIARHLTNRVAELGNIERTAFQSGRQVRRGQGYSLHVTAPPVAHRVLLAVAEMAAGEDMSSADRKALRIYRDRLNAAAGEDKES